MLRILYINPNKSDILMIEKTINEMGHVIFSVSGKSEIFEELKRSRVDLIIIGLELNGNDEESIIMAVNDSEFRHIPIMAITPTDGLEVRDRLFSLGIVDYILKDDLVQDKLDHYFRRLLDVEHDYEKIRAFNVAVLSEGQSLNMIEKILKMDDFFRVDYFSDPVILMNTDKHYALYLLDLVIPGISGEQVVAQLRRKNENSVILLTSNVANYKKISNCLAYGADDYIMKPFDANIFMTRISAQMNTLLLKNEMKEKNEALSQLSIRDALTGIHNRKYVMDGLEKEILRAERYTESLSIILVGIDNFMKINDRFGHPVGDMVLKQVASILEDTVRKTDIIGRFSGDEFLIVLPQTDSKSAIGVMNKIRKLIESQAYAVEDLKATISCGVAVYSQNTSKEMVKKAEVNLFLAKKFGKNRVIYEF